MTNAELIQETINELCLQFGCPDFYSLTDIDFKCGRCKISHCKTCFTNVEGKSKCVECIDGFFLKNDNNCEPCAANCKFCTEKWTCLPNGCSTGYLRHRTKGSCIPCPGNGVNHCEYRNLQSDDLITISCTPGYSMINMNNQISCEGKYQIYVKQQNIYS